MNAHRKKWYHSMRGRGHLEWTRLPGEKKTELILVNTNVGRNELGERVAQGVAESRIPAVHKPSIVAEAVVKTRRGK